MAKIKAVAPIVMILSLIGIMLVEIATNRPVRFAADPLAGRVCPALFVAKPSEYWLYYTTPGACALSWSFVAALLIAAMFLAIDRYWRS